ncbi:hypothetical protein [Xylophilus sp.]|uniref:hypothetical protein n=1 Tax=Xylophilus sp. TaxID=2653893 RepID=UPI002D80A268|nr:hypothetical protein [Xylophilus sp.]
MLQSLISLEDDQIDLVMDCVNQWCEIRRVEIDSVEGRRALNVAVNILCSRRPRNLLEEMSAQLDPPLDAT